MKSVEKEALIESFIIINKLDDGIFFFTADFPFLKDTSRGKISSIFQIFFLCSVINFTARTS
jgi:hypothetical protein